MLQVPELFGEANLDAGDQRLTPVRCELWGGVDQSDDDAPPLRDQPRTVRVQT